MTKVIIIQGGSLENYYNMTMDYLLAKYHSYSSSSGAAKNREDGRHLEHYRITAHNSDTDSFSTTYPPSLP